MPGLVEDLLRPENYPPPHPASVTLLSTPLSLVFLTDREAWKVKRPLHRGRLDCTDPAARERLCHEEVRLNRRLAPHVYLGVLPVRRDAAGHSFGRDGVIVDFAVRMRRLPEERCARALLEAGRLDHGHVESLADLMADFYRSAAKVPRPGAVAALRERLEEDLAEAGSLAGGPVHREDLDAIRGLLRGFLARRGADLRARAAEGRVLEAHGDLRLEHVFFEEGRRVPTVVDAADHHARFGGLDPAADAALLAADLEASGRPDLGDRFLARLASSSGDFGMYGVLDFHLCWRAAARAKTLGLFAREAGPSGPAARRAALEAGRLFEVAARVARREPGKPPLVAVCGVFGAGKTTLAEALSRRLGLPVVGSAGDGLPGALDRAEAVLSSGRGAILDAGLRTRGQRARARRLAARHGHPLVLVEVACPDRLLRERLHLRETGAPLLASAGLPERGWRAYEPAAEAPGIEVLRVDASRPPAALALDVEGVLHHHARP